MRPAVPVPPRAAPVSIKHFQEFEEEDLIQQHCLLGSLAPSKVSPQRYPAMLLNNILGGAGMSSRLNMSVREKHGLVYSIQSGYSLYQDAAVFSIYFAADPKAIKKCYRLIETECKQLYDKQINERTFRMYQQQLIGAVAMQVENPAALMHHGARSYLDHARVTTIEEFNDSVRLVTPAEIQEVAYQLLSPENWSRLEF